MRVFFSHRSSFLLVYRSFNFYIHCDGQNGLPKTCMARELCECDEVITLSWGFYPGLSEWACYNPNGHYEWEA